MGKMQEMHLHPYINEIKTNARGAIYLIEKGKEKENLNFEKVIYYTLAVNLASMISQIAYHNVTPNKYREKRQRTQERLDLINSSYPNLPSLPVYLRTIRNNSQHFDEKLDDWIFSRIENGGGYSYIQTIDGDIEYYNTGVDYPLQRRIDDNGNLVYWDTTINIDELLDWCKEIIEYLK